MKPCKSPVQFRLIPYSIHFRASQPLPNRGILMRNFVDNGNGTGNGQIVINVNKPATSGAQDFAAVVGDLATALALPNNYAAVPAAAKLTQVGMTTTYTRMADVVNIPIAAHRNNNYKVLIAAYDNTGARIETEAFAFVAMPPRAVVRVSAGACLFLAYTSFGVATPNGEVLPDHSPAEAIAAIDATSVRVSVLPIGGVDQTWSYNGENYTTANGETNLMIGFTNPNTTNALYRTAALGSTNIKASGALLHHRLVGMWDFGPENAADFNACQETDIGVGTATLSVPQIVSGTEILTPIKLLLGAHSSENWTNNTGSLDVTLEWSVGLI